VTPLASIIGSGFLVVAPLLGSIMGDQAPIAMLGIVVVAFLIGAVIRFNIAHLEERIDDRSCGKVVLHVEQASGVALGLAYVVSVAFYLRLLGAFALRGIGITSEVGDQIIATLLLLLIGATGARRGLHGLERAEQVSVSVKLSIIVSLLVGLALRTADTGTVPGALFHEPQGPVGGIGSLRLLFGLLLVIQGFETSRYLGHEYDRPTRVRTMRRAQLLSGAVYVTFVFLVLPLLPLLPPGPASETGIIDAVSYVSPILPVLLVIAALMSQFSAGVADTIGAGGLLSEASRGRLSDRRAYLAICLAAIALLWTVDMFAIITLASRAFALYYFLQTVAALVTARHVLSGARKAWAQAGLFALALLLLAVVLFALPAE